MAYMSSVFSSDGPNCLELKTSKCFSNKQSHLLVGAILTTFWNFNLFWENNNTKIRKLFNMNNSVSQIMRVLKWTTDMKLDGFHRFSKLS